MNRSSWMWGSVTVSSARSDSMRPEAQFRFKRVSHVLSDFTPASTHLQTTEGLHWTKWPFATRLLDGGPDRVTLLADKLKLTRGGETEEIPVAEDEWAATLRQWFDMDVPG